MGAGPARVILPHDLRLRIVTVVGVLLALSSLTHAGPGFAWLALAIALAVMDPNPFPWRRLLHLEAFLLLLLITLPLTIPGEALVSVWGLTVSQEGLARAILVVAKVTAAMLVLTVGFSRVEPTRLGQALRGLRCPEGLVRLFLGVVRYVDLIRAEATRLQEAMRMRSFAPRSTLHTWRSYGNLIGMVLLRALARADRVEEAMRLRSYAGRFPIPASVPITRRDWVSGLLCLAVAVGLLLWDRP